MMMIGTTADWSAGVPPEILRKISENLSTVLDFIRFRAVCKAWRSAVHPADVPPQLPWLMLSYDPDTDLRPFYSPATGTIHSLRLPEFRGKLICGGSVHGWLVLFYEHNNLIFLSLLQPLTRSHIALPCLRSQLGSLKVDAARLSGSPTSLSTCTVLVVLWWGSVKIMTLCHLGPDGRWSRWSNIKTTLPCYANDIAICGSRKVYVTDRTQLRVHDAIPPLSSSAAAAASNTRLITLPMSVRHMQTFLVESSEGLLLVGTFWCTQDGGTQFEVYRLSDESGEELSWIKIQDLGDRLFFFLRHNQSFAISASDTKAPAGCQHGGNAYMTAARSTYCLKDGRVCQLQLDLEAKQVHSFPLWFVPRLCP